MQRGNYSFAEFEAALADVEVPVRSARKPANGGNGRRGKAGDRRPQEPATTVFDRVNEAALAMLSRWVEKALPGGAWQATGAYRLSSETMLQPEFEEALSAHPDGIRDFGSEQPLTPIGAVAKYCTRGDDGKMLKIAERDADGNRPNTLTTDDAEKWLADRLGLDLEKLRSDYINHIFADPWFDVDALAETASADTIHEQMTVVELDWLRAACPKEYERVASRLAERGVITGGALDKLLGPEDIPPAARAASLADIKPFLLRSTALIEPRRWLYGHHYLAKNLGATIAPGGMGKSSLVLGEVLAMVTEKPLLGVTPNNGDPLRVLYINLEDGRDEIERRVAAFCQCTNIGPEELGDRLFVLSGRDHAICIARMERGTLQIETATIDTLRKVIRENGIDVVVIDPFVAAHAVPENDNNAINAVCHELRMLAEETGCAIELVHHTRKGASGDQGERTVDDARGASSLHGAVRSARVLNTMTRDEAARIGIENPRSYFRVYQGKSNHAPPAESSTWYRLANERLANGDDVGVVVPWQWPNLSDELTSDNIQAIQAAISTGSWKADVRAGAAWAGHAVADALGWDRDTPAAKGKLKGVLQSLVQDGYLRTQSGFDAKGNRRVFVVVGKSNRGKGGCST
jgi:AAA domain